jgi:hypothetical protein
MKVVAFSVTFFGGIFGASYGAGLVALALTGCAGTAASTEDATDQDITAAARPPVDLPSTEDGSSVQGKLYPILKAFESDPSFGVFAPTDGNLLVLQGGVEPHVPLRSIGCQETSRVDPSALAPILAHECTLTGFDAVKNGASLPPSLPSVADGAPPLASKLFSLLAAAEKKGGLGVRRGGQQASCCDQQSSTSYTVADAHSSLACTATSGGFVSITSVSCLYLRQDAVPPEVVKGTLFASVGIGGENTGFSAKVDGGTIELVLEKADQARFVDGRVARITGLPTTLSGIETQNRPAIDVTNFLVCPVPGTSPSPKPGNAADTKWITANCPIK